MFALHVYHMGGRLDVIQTSAVWRTDAECLARSWLIGDVTSVTIVLQTTGTHYGTFYNPRIVA